MYAGKTLQAGDEITISYGDKCNLEVFSVFVVLRVLACVFGGTTPRRFCPPLCCVALTCVCGGTLCVCTMRLARKRTYVCEQLHVHYGFSVADNQR